MYERGLGRHLAQASGRLWVTSLSLSRDLKSGHTGAQQRIKFGLRAEIYYETSHKNIARQINIFNILQMLVSLTAVRPNKPNII